MSKETKTPKTSWIPFVGVVVGVLALGGGCGAHAGASPPSGTPATVTPDDEMVAVGEHHRFHHHGGVGLFIAMSVDTLGVSTEQRAAVDEIRRDLRAAMAPARAAEDQLLTALADGLVASAFDATKVDGDLDQLGQAAAGAGAASADALNRLHAVLTPAQRAALVDKVEAHWGIWRKENPAGAAVDARRTDLVPLSSELELTSDQVAKIHAALGGGPQPSAHGDGAAVTAHIAAFGEAFRRDTFDAHLLTTGPAADAHLVGWGGAHLARVVEAMSPVLTPEQRAALAQRLREHATHAPTPGGNT